MPLVGVNRAADDIIDIISMDGSNGNDLMANESGSDNGTLTKINKAKNENSEKETSLAQLLLNLVNSGNEKACETGFRLNGFGLYKRKCFRKFR